MLPDGLEVLTIALALVPGWLYLRLRTRVRPPSGTAGLSELLEVAAMGLITTGISVLVLSLLPHSWLPALVDVEAWAAQGNAYLQHHIHAALRSGALVLLLASSIAVALHYVQRRSSKDSFDPSSSVWGKALGMRPTATTPWVGVQLRDGRLVEGILHSISVGEENDDRDIALAGPIRVREPKAGSEYMVEVDRLVVPAREIVFITIIYAPEAAPPTP